MGIQRSMNPADLAASTAAAAGLGWDMSFVVSKPKKGTLLVQPYYTMPYHVIPCHTLSYHTRWINHFNCKKMQKSISITQQQPWPLSCRYLGQVNHASALPIGKVKRPEGQQVICPRPGVAISTSLFSVALQSPPFLKDYKDSQGTIT